VKSFFHFFAFACLVLFALHGSAVQAHPFSVNISALGDNDNVAGTATGALDEYDALFDQPDTEYVSLLYFPHPEWNHTSENFKHDIKAPYNPMSEIKQWT